MSGEESLRPDVQEVDNPLSKASLSWVGRCVKVELPLRDGVPLSSMLRIELGEQDFKGVDPSSVQIFYIEPESGTVLPIPGSGVDPSQRIAFAEIKRPGVYGVIGLPTDRRILDTIRTFGLWHDHLLELDEPGRRSFIQDICELILCVGGDPGGLLGDICDSCVSLEIPRDGLPEHGLLRDWQRQPLKPTTRVVNGLIAYVRAPLTPGSQIFWVPFDAPGQIYVMDANGAGRHKISQGQGNYSQPAWSPQGNQLACFRAFTNRPFGIVTMAPDGSNEFPVTWDWDTHPSWSPDGMQLVFAGWGPGALRQLFLVNSDGSNRHQLTMSASDKDLPAWSPDGNTIAHSSSGRLWLIDADGTNAREACATRFDLFSVPAWSPDSKKVVAYGWTPPGSVGLFEVEIATKVSKPFRHEDCCGASWAPEGNFIVYSDVKQLNYPPSIQSADLHIIKPDGSNDRALPEGPGFMAVNPSWQPLIVSAWV